MSEIKNDKQNFLTLIDCIKSEITRSVPNANIIGNKITEWSEIPSDDNYPSEKLVKEALDSISTGGGIDLPSDLSNLIDTNTSDKVYYVDYVNGNDENDGETEATAFKTLEHAWDKIPTFFKNNYTIKIITSYRVGAILKGGKYSALFGRYIRIVGNDTSNYIPMGKLIINNVHAFSDSLVGGTSVLKGGLVISGFIFDGDGFLTIDNTDIVNIKKCKFDYSIFTERIGFLLYNTKCYMENCEFIQKTGSTKNIFVTSSFSRVYCNLCKFNGKSPIKVSGMSEVKLYSATFTSTTTKYTVDKTSTCTILS